MQFLVAVASRHGSTHEIADALARELRSAGHVVDVRAVEDTASVEDYDAVVVGSAVYMGKWLPQAAQFVDRHREQLAARPVWLFSSGPVGAEDPQPKDAPVHVDQVIEQTGARGHKVFVGKLDKGELGLGERLLVRVAGAPEGDFRDWAAITAWAHEIALEAQPGVP